MRQISSLKNLIPEDRTELVCILVSIYVYFIGFFISNFGISDAALYFSDIIMVLLIVLIFCKYKNTIKYKDIIKKDKFSIWILMLLLLVCIGTISATVNGISVLRWLWAIRNWGRFFVYFIVCASILTKKSLDSFLEFTLGLFNINFLVILFQFIFMRQIIGQDGLNGLVGRETSGANIILVLAAIIVASAKYFSQRYTIWQLLRILLEAFIVSVLAELKAVILFIIVIFSLMMLINMDFKKENIMRLMKWFVPLVVCGFIALFVTSRIYPMFEEVFTFKGIFEHICNPYGYGYSGYIDRLNAVKVINEHFFNKLGLVTKLTGLGIGNAEYSSFGFLRSSFYNTYGTTYGYLWFSVPMLYLETGYIGLILYFLLMIWLAVKSGKLSRINKTKADKYYYNVGFGMAIILIIFIIYNNLQRTDMGFLFGIYAAAPWIVLNDNIRSGGTQNEAY